MSQIKQEIALNFVSLKSQDFSFIIFRRLVKKEETRFDKYIHKYNLPEKRGSESYQSYWISFSHFENAEEFQAKSGDNIYLAQWYLAKQLKAKANEEDIVFLENESHL